MNSIKSTSFFTRFAKWTSHMAGQPAAFVIAVTTLLLWAVSGPLFGFSDTWQLIINTGHDDRHVPDGVPDPKHPKSRFGSTSRKA